LHRMKSQRDEMHKRIMVIERMRAKLFPQPFMLTSDRESA
jgi:hypothetical protein